MLDLDIQEPMFEDEGVKSFFQNPKKKKEVKKIMIEKILIRRSKNNHPKVKIGFTVSKSPGNEKRRVRLTLNLKGKENGNFDKVKEAIRKISEKRGEDLFTMRLKEIRHEIFQTMSIVEDDEKEKPHDGEVKEIKQEIIQKVKKDLCLPSKSMYAVEEESANTKVCLAPSFSGKTTLMVN